MLSTVHSSPQSAISFSHLANMTSMINMPSTNDTKNVFGNSVGSKHCALKIMKLLENIPKIK